MITEFPLFIFTLCVGLSAGTYAMSAVFPLSKNRTRPWLFPLVCLTLLAIGLLGVLGHLGHPEHFWYGLRNPTAGIAQEAYFSILFGALVFSDLILAIRKGSSPRWLSISAAVVGIGLTFVMGFAYYVSYGTIAWATWTTVPLFVVSDLALGAALYTLFEKAAFKKLSFLITFIALEILTAIILAAEAIRFSDVGYNSTLFVVAIFIAPVASIILSWVANKKGNIALPVIFSFVLIGIAVSRWAFYSGSII